MLSTEIFLNFIRYRQLGGRQDFETFRAQTLAVLRRYE